MKHTSIQLDERARIFSQVVRALSEYKHGEFIEAELWRTGLPVVFENYESVSAKTP